MPFERTMLNSIVEQCRIQGNELPWIEFKVNNYDPQEVGEYISAISNSAALFNQSTGFVVWGIDDKTHEFVGTTFDPKNSKVGNQVKILIN